MSDVLSQEEIDRLLNALDSGELDADDMKEKDERQIKDYDFARPSKFAKDHLKTLEFIFEHFGRLLSTNLPGYLRKNVQIEVMNSEAITYFEFTNALSNPVLLGIVDFAPLEGNILIELAASLGYAIVDRLLGGRGVPLDRSREFSEIELILLEKIVNVCTSLLVEPWASVTAIEPRLERIETNSQFAQIVSPSEMTAIVTMNVTIGDVEGLMNVCIPYSCVESVVDKLNTKFWYSTMQASNNNSYREVIESTLSRAKIPVRAVLGKSTVSVNDFINLQMGDIIRLNSKVDEELDVYVGSIKKFKALPGAAGDSYAVRVVSIIEEE